jgi:hypothetical protein
MFVRLWWGILALLTLTGNTAVFTLNLRLMQSTALQSAVNSQHHFLTVIVKHDTFHPPLVIDIFLPLMAVPKFMAIPTISSP